MKQLTHLKHERGISLWLILPWVLSAVLALVLGLTFFHHQNSQPQTVESITQPVWTPTTQPPALATATQGVYSYKDAVNRAAKSVVNIYTTQTIKHPYMNDPIFRELFERYYGQQGQGNQQGVSSLGSGVIISKDGYIVTNAHVISQADEIIVALHDGTKARATIIGSDEDSDLAVIKVALDNLEPAAFRNTPIEVGDVTLAIGNPFGVGQTVTQGIVSATGRAGLGISSFEDFIQTDAAINPGNSGGALVDADGALIGINTVIYSRSGGSMGIGFAIPTSIVEQVVNALMTNGKVSRGWLGVGIAQTHSPTDLQAAGGVLISQVWEGTPAWQAGLQAGDVIVSIDGTSINNANTLTGIIAKHAPNTQLSVQISRDGKTQEITVTLGERPSTRQ